MTSCYFCIASCDVQYINSTGRNFKSLLLPVKWYEALHIPTSRTWSAITHCVSIEYVKHYTVYNNIRGYKDIIYWKNIHVQGENTWDAHVIQEAIRPLKISNAKLMWSKQPKTANKIKPWNPCHIEYTRSISMEIFRIKGGRKGKTAVSHLTTTYLLNVAKQLLSRHIFQFKLPAHTMHVISTLPQLALCKLL